MHRLVLVGPTGTGKTAVAIELCEMLDGEIVSADSMQVYRGLNIATAKPSAAELARARHHLIDIIEPGAAYSAAQWAHDARAAIADIESRDKIAVIAGGTGFYLRALFEPATLAAAAPDAALRAALQNEVAAYGAAALHERLAGMDAAAAARLHPHDVRRVMRAIEVVTAKINANLPGRLASNSPSPSLGPSRPIEADSLNIFALTMERAALVRRLEERIDGMLRGGFMDELRRLVAIGLPEDSIVLQGVGYRQMRPVLANPALFDECVALWKRDTRRYAKRQVTWFTHQLPAQWIEIAAETPALAAAERIAALWRACQNSC